MRLCVSPLPYLPSIRCHLAHTDDPSITGGTRGIGARMALALSKAGADLILVQRNDTNTATRDLLRKEGGLDGSGGKADIVVCDLADKKDVATLIPRMTGEMGRTLDIVVNCGMSSPLSLRVSLESSSTWIRFR